MVRAARRAWCTCQRDSECCAPSLDCISFDIIHKKGIVEGIGFNVQKLQITVADAGGRATIANRVLEATVGYGSFLAHTMEDRRRFLLVFAKIEIKRKDERRINRVLSTNVVVSRVTYYICVWCAMKCVVSMNANCDQGTGAKCNSCEGMESYARCKTPVSGTSVNIKELQTTEKRNVLLSVVSNAQYNAQQHCSMMHMTMKV
ncbi:conserved hypothetical protein [Trichinella spiralis]|uniref:hypothetical protein n=1 Tax=Trichinella spiralis TaxID=6334 RepID=UPI0001EFD3B5|nr:conserved hypothetical protein [Trichinella spiralis]